MKFDPNQENYYPVTSSETAKRIMTAGNGVLTLVGPAGTAHTYKFAKPRNAQEFSPKTIFVYALHDNKTFYLGRLTSDGFRLTAASKFGEHTEIVKGAHYLYRLSTDQSLLDRTPMRLFHHSRCCKCGRALTSEKALELGIGRKCNVWYELFINEMDWDGNS